jgi:hypothetical protein
MLLKVFIEHTVTLLLEAVLHIMTFILCWGMNIHNNDVTPATSQYHVRHPITNKLNLLNC